jgi:Cu+-exporting ATPase
MSENEKTLKLKAKDITCSGCAMDMENILNEKDGIIEAKVDFSAGTVDVRHDPGKIDSKKVFDEVRKLGFKTEVIKD